jgi:hypothetical protein
MAIDSNLDIQNVDVSINLPSSGLTIVDSIRTWLDDIVADIRTGDDEIVLAIISSLMIVVTFTYIWRKI